MRCLHWCKTVKPVANFLQTVSCRYNTANLLRQTKYCMGRFVGRPRHSSLTELLEQLQSSICNAQALLSGCMALCMQLLNLDYPRQSQACTVPPLMRDAVMLVQTTWEQSSV